MSQSLWERFIQKFTHDPPVGLDVIVFASHHCAPKYGWSVQPEAWSVLKG
jgi:hypothetical protein